MLSRRRTPRTGHVIRRIKGIAGGLGPDAGALEGRSLGRGCPKAQAIAAFLAKWSALVQMPASG